jgi:nitrosocyanin
VTTDLRRRGRKAAAPIAALALILASVGCSHKTERHAIAAALVSSAPGFSPETVTVDKEDTIILNVGNGTDKTHGFSIEGYKIRKTVDPNQKLRVKFRASRAGTFKIFCQLHPTHQTATLVVR